MESLPLRPDGVFPPGLPNLPHLALRNPADLYAALHRAAPIRHCHSLVPDQQFLHEVGYVDIGGSVLLSQTGSATDFLVEHSPKLSLVTVFHGQISLDTAGGQIHLVEQGVALLPTGLRHSQGAHSLASITLNPVQVAAAAAAMAGRSGDKAIPPREHFPVIHLPPGSTQGGTIRNLLQTIHSCTAMGPAMATHLGLEDVILRSAAALLHPALLKKEPADLLRYRDPAGRRSFDDLIDYIRANLDQPLRLSDLESRSHYSRRALQYAFRERLNSSPKQWIREQRLALALDILQRQGPQLSVKVVALRCGYLHVSQFSRDFKLRFGISPSQVRRL
ncbi:MAG: AraC family transcriptional regulator [Cyanobacteriota bacterium]|nr:AraC family transcriptional regulator [Cyanobacteriota bacterium]